MNNILIVIGILILVVFLYLATNQSIRDAFCLSVPYSLRSPSEGGYSVQSPSEGVYLSEKGNSSDLSFPYQITGSNMFSANNKPATPGQYISLGSRNYGQQFYDFNRGSPYVGDA